MIDQIQNDVFCVQVNRKGAELWSVFNKRQNRECLWQGDSAVWARRAPNLFPVCGGLRQNKACFDGKAYLMPQHGFLRDYEHALVEKTENRIRFRMIDNKETRNMYPFSFCVETEFRLSSYGLKQTFWVQNTQDTPLSFSIGYHTGWMCPFDTEHAIDNYCLIFEKEEQIQIPCGRAGESRGRERGIIHLRDGIFDPCVVIQSLKSRWVRLEEKDSGRFIQVGLEKFPALVLWSAPGKTRFVCIEPWHGMFEPVGQYGEFANKPFVINLPSRRTFSCEMTVCIGKGQI